jgi:hypothetical protein
MYCGLYFWLSLIGHANVGQSSRPEELDFEQFEQQGK